MATQPSLDEAERAILAVFQRFGTRPGESIKMIALTDLTVGPDSFRADELNVALQSMADKGWIGAGRTGFYTLTDAGYAQLGGRIDQRVQDLVNLDKPIQDFLGWALALDRERFCAALEHAGHQTPSYHDEKWAEFERNKLGFLWHWTPEFVAAWSARV